MISFIIIITIITIIIIIITTTTTTTATTRLIILASAVMSFNDLSETDVFLCQSSVYEKISMELKIKQTLSRFVQTAL